MPRKIRQLKSDLIAAGFRRLPGRGRGSHTFWEHSEYPDVSVTLSGHDGDDALKYQEQQVARAIRESKKEGTEGA